MRNLDFEYTFTPIGIEDIEDFENKYGILLPDDYKQFLLSKNGGKTEQRRFKTNDTTKKGVITSSVSMFFPLSIENEINLEEKLRSYNLMQVVPSNFLPIGIDPREFDLFIN